MQVLKLSDVRKSNDPLRAEIARLIAVVDTPRFEAELFEVAHGALNCAHVTAFVANSETRPRLVLAANVGDEPVARMLSDKYISRYWDLDPANRAPLGPQDESVALRVVTDTDIDDYFYRRDCYTALQICERVSLVQRRGRDVYRLNFYAAGPNGRFAAPVYDHLMESGDLLMSLLMKSDTAAVADATPESFTRRLRLIAPAIPQREAEVCTAIMLGMTSEAIALKLGISVNTVLTYRKRAYTRLNISCQNELMRLILS
jgi:DNA-binding CsgD family transcriptional regulator